MHASVEILNRTVQVEWSRAAEAALAKLSAPLAVEMELYFSCLLRKKVRFGEQARSREYVQVNPQLQLAFRPVMTTVCAADSCEGEPPVEDFAIVNPAAYVPHWLKIDYRHGQWQGEFGFSNNH